MRVLITRPEPDASRTAAKLKQLGHETVVDPLLALELLPPRALPSGLFAAIAVTSANAIRVAGVKVELVQLRTLPLFAVGGRSAEAAREAGFRNVLNADGNAAALAELIARTLPPGSNVLHLAGEDRAQDLAGLLAPANISVEVFVLYRMRQSQAFGAAAVALSAARLDAVLHFSPRSATAFAAISERKGFLDRVRKLRHICISHATAAPLIAIGAKVEVADKPSEDAVMALLDS
jgi:uroporphyrinogen-III synthase